MTAIITRDGPLTCAFTVWGCLDLNQGPLPYQGCFSARRHVLQSRSADLPDYPRVTVTVPNRPPDRARGGHGPLIRRNG
jgi:hypothetical protein